MRIFKKLLRCTTVSTPYKCTPRIMIEANLEDKVNRNKSFTPRDYILQSIRPSGMILGQDKPDYPNLKLDFGQYCQVYENTRNDMIPRRVGGIVPRPKRDRGS